MKKLLFCALVLSCGLGFSQNPGDIAFVGYNTDGQKAFSIVVLSDIDGSGVSTEIYFTDDDWDGTSFAGLEGTITWTVSSLVTAGTVVDFTDVSGTVAVSVGTAIESSAFNPVNGSDAVYCYVGSLGTPTTFLGAISNDDFTSDDHKLTGTGLTVGTHAIEFRPVDLDADIAEYTGTRTGIRSLLLTTINDAANWLTQDDTGDQSDDEIEPDVPFNATSFTITSLSWDGGNQESDNWNNASNWLGGGVPTILDNVIIADTGIDPEFGSVESTEDYAVNNLTIEAGASIFLNSGSSLAIFGAVSNSGDFIMQRNSEGDGGYSVMSSPVENETIDNLTDANFVYSFDGSSFSSNLAGAEISMNPGQGYFVGSNSEGPTMEFSGTPNSGTITYSVTSGNFELVGNPYSAAISITDFLSANSSVINSAVYFWDDGGSNSGTSGKRGGDYITTNGMGTANAVEPDGVTDNVTGQNGIDGAENGYITSSQGFFVEASISGDVSFNQSMQVTTADANQDGNYYRTAEIEYQKVKLAISGNGLYNEILVGLGEDATFERDPHLDATKLVSENPLSFYSLMGDEKYIIQGLPLASSESIIVPLGFDAEEGSFDFSIISMDNIPENLQVILVDKMTGISYDLKEIESFTFSSGIVQNDQRFELQFNPSNILSVDEVSSKLKVSGNTSELSIQSNISGSHVITIYTLDGKVAFHKEVSFSNNSAKIKPRLTQNKMYVLRIGEESFKFVIQ